MLPLSRNTILQLGMLESFRYHQSRLFLSSKYYCTDMLDVDERIQKHCTPTRGRNGRIRVFKD